jgi:hypothetical protein
MIKYNQELIDSIHNKRTEIWYNEWYIGPKNLSFRSKIELKGKIKCAVLNMRVSPLVCSKLMEMEGWPRKIDSEVCKKCDCVIYFSLNKYKNTKPKEPINEKKT